MAVQIPSEPSRPSSAPEPVQVPRIASSRIICFHPQFDACAFGRQYKSQSIFHLPSGSTRIISGSCAISGYKEIACLTPSPKSSPSRSRWLCYQNANINQTIVRLFEVETDSIRVSPWHTLQGSRRRRPFLGATVNVNFKLNLLT